MSNSDRKNELDDDGVGLLGAYAIGGPGLVGARLLGGFLDEGSSRSRELGPAPIGSDPWLRAQIRAAIASEKDLDAARVAVSVEEAVVTVTGSLAEVDRSRLERAVRTVQGIKRLVVDFDGPTSAPR